jgi:phage baseplate assembly protein gpV/phage protein D
MTTIDLVAPAITISGSPLPATSLNSLVSLRVQRGVCVVGRATLRFSDDGFTLSASGTFALGTDVKITVPGKGELMSGTVTGVSLEQSRSAVPELVVVVDDAGYKLARGAKPASYLQMSYADVLRKIAGQIGLTANVSSGAKLTTVYEYLLQTGTALAFVDQIARLTGSVWWIDDKKLVVEQGGTSVGTCELALGDELVEFSVRASGLRPTGVKVSGWNRDQQQAIIGQSSPSSGSVPTFVAAYSGGAPASTLGEAVTSTAELIPTTQNDADVLAEASYDAEEAGAVVARGSCFVDATIKPAVTVQVKNAGPASGSYLVSEVEHSYSRRGFMTHFVAGPRRPTGLVDTLGNRGPDPGMQIGTLVVGKVTNTNDPDNAGRVKVKHAALDGDVESDWARVVTIGAGGQRGMVFQPEVNDEVLVGFEYGDTRRPVVIGGLFSKVNALPESDKLFGSQGTVDYRRITSRKNHVIELGDGESETTQHILLQLGTAQHKLRLGADEFAIEVASGIPVTIKAADTQFAISKTGDVTIEGNNISIKAKQQLALEGVSTSLKATGSGQIQAATLDVKANGTASVDGGGMLALKGGMVQIN